MLVSQIIAQATDQTQTLDSDLNVNFLKETKQLVHHWNVEKLGHFLHSLTQNIAEMLVSLFIAAQITDTCSSVNHPKSMRELQVVENALANF